MNTIQKRIPEELSNYIEIQMYETNARKDLCAYMISHSMDNTESFDKYHNEYMECYSKYEIAKKELERTYITEEYPNCKWHLDFTTSTLIIEVIDNGSGKQ